MLACHIRLCLGRLGDGSKDSIMSLSYPFANCETDGTHTVALVLVLESQLSRWTAPTLEVAWTAPQLTGSRSTKALQGSRSTALPQESKLTITQAMAGT